MLTSTLARTSVLALLIGLAASCQTPIAPRPAQPGDWHIEGSTSALYTTTQSGDYGDTDTFALRFAGGRFVTDQILVEGLADVNDTTFEDNANNEIRTTAMDLGIGGRYYTTTEGSSRPYLAVNTGFNFVDIHDDFTGSDDSDTSPFVGASLGLEAFVGSSEDDLATYGVFVGFSLWL